jgi:hypothetical protein
MKVEQIKGPFSAGAYKMFGGTDGRIYTHIGIQVPKRQPLGYTTFRAIDEGLSSDSIPELVEPIVPSKYCDVTIIFGSESDSKSSYDYKISEKGILEFDGSFTNGITVKFLRALPPETIIDIAYKEEGE